jgi:hypothetical protein
MRARIMGRLIGLLVIEFATGVSWLFCFNRLLVMVAMIGLPILALTVALPIVLLIRSNRSSTQNRPAAQIRTPRDSTRDGRLGHKRSDDSDQNWPSQAPCRKLPIELQHFLVIFLAGPRIDV